MRLIVADTAEKKLAELVELYEKRMPNWSPNDMLTSGRDAAFKWGFKADGAEKALEIIKDMPTVDAEPIVRCKYCDFVDTLDCPMNYIDKQRQIFTNRSPDWFCAEGRRNENKK